MSESIRQTDFSLYYSFIPLRCDGMFVFKRPQRPKSLRELMKPHSDTSSAACGEFGLWRESLPPAATFLRR